MDSLNKAWELLKQKQFSVGIDLLEKFLQNNPKHVEALALLTAARLDSGLETQAYQDCLILESQAPFHFFTHSLKARCLEKKGDLHEALASYALAYSLNPQHEPSFLSWKKLASVLGILDSFICQDDLVFVTGGFFFSLTFNGQTPATKAIGGSESALVGLTRALAKRGHKITVYCNCDLPGIYDQVTYRSNRDFFVANRLKNPRLLVSLRFDEYLRTPIAAQKKILWVQDIPETPLYEHVGSKGLEMDFLLCLSEYQKKLWSKKFFLDPQKIILTRNGFDPEFSVLPDRARKKNLVYMSRPSRGLKICLDVFDRLKSELPDLTLTVCAYTQESRLEDDPELKPFLPRIQQTQGIIFLGGLSKPQLAQLLGTSSLLLYPNTSALETSCMAAIESMAQGCPVVTSDKGALPETVNDGVGGVVVPYSLNDEELTSTLFKATSHLMQSPQEWKKLSDSARQYAYKRFDWNVLACEWESFLR